MSIKVERKGDKITVETDYRDSGGVSHSAVYNDPQLLGGMKVCGIDKIEARVNDSSDTTWTLHDEFDKKYKEKYGKTSGYFNP
jgi:hypothetical protein